MSGSMMSEEQLRRLAHAHASAVIDAGSDVQGSAVHQTMLERFRETWQPQLSDKEYTALYRTYCNWAIAEISNRMSPGSAGRGRTLMLR